ncbi:MAG: slipin family protein, partial [Cyanobacteria bacterium SZAS LIN-3]|nr:slipin family protein [Cyanobacteria bacterium SZAS LIN-3]
MEVLGLGVSFFIFVGLGIIYILIRYCLRVASEWERKVVLRLGRFAGVRGPGLFFLLPFFETTPFTIDLRTVTSNISAEQTLTRDN